MECIILAGGLGTRLRPVTGDAVPKPMAMINHKPFLAYLLDYLSNQKITRAILSTGYLSTKIADYFEHQYKNIEILYSIEETPLGTGGAILAAEKHTKEDDFFIINGDSFLELNYEKMMLSHKKNQREITMAIHYQKNCAAYGSVQLSEEKIVSFNASGEEESGWINAGVYAFNKEKLKKQISSISSKNFSLERDLLAPMCTKEKVFYFKSKGAFIDIGTPENFNLAFHILDKA